MPKVSSFLYTELSQVETVNQGGSRLHIINPKHVFFIPFIPSQFSFAVVFGILGVDFSNEQIIKYCLKNPKGNIIFDSGDVSMSTILDEEQKKLPIEWRGVFINIDVRNVSFENEGIYQSEVYLNSDLLGSYPIQVVKGSKKS